MEEDELDPAAISYCRERFQKYLAEYHLDEVIKILEEPSSSSHHFVVEADFPVLYSASQKLGSLLVEFPLRFFEIFSSVLLEMQETLTQEMANEGELDKELSVKKNCKVRVTNIAQIAWTCPGGRLPGSQDVSRLVVIRGTVTRAGATKMLEFRREMECGTCKARWECLADPLQYYAFPKVYRCPTGRAPPCNPKKLKTIEGSAECKDYQELKIQEQIQKLECGAVPRSMLIVLEDDLVDACQAGDDIVVTGVVVARWNPLYDGDQCVLDIVLLAHHVRVTNQHNNVAVTEELSGEVEKYWEAYRDRKLAGRNFILQSICPQMYGLFFVKLAVALMALGGVRRSQTNMRIRGEIHVLLVGDPGTGKSQFLKFISKLLPRSILTTGIGTTSAGLTVTAVRDASTGEWMFEAGALVLADGGVCCIDEFDSIRSHERTTIHEAMEQQSLSVAKAGLVCTLNTRASVLAATNPKVKFDQEHSLSANVGISGPLLSRFDLVLLLLDQENSEWDRNVSDYILHGQHAPSETSFVVSKQNASVSFETNSQSSQNPQQSGSSQHLREEKIEGSQDTHPKVKPWSMETLQAYISLAKEKINPVMTPESETILTAYYRKQRKCDYMDQARTTVRLLESLIRLSQAHARLMWREEVLVQDAVMAIVLMECSSHTSSILNIESVMRSTFPEDPDSDYLVHEDRVLKALGLSRETLSDGYAQDVPSSPPRRNRTQREYHHGFDPDADEEVLDGESFDPAEHSQYSQQNRLRRNQNKETETRSDPPSEELPSRGVSDEEKQWTNSSQVLSLSSEDSFGPLGQQDSHPNSPNVSILSPVPDVLDPPASSQSPNPKETSPPEDVLQQHSCSQPIPETPDDYQGEAHSQSQPPPLPSPFLKTSQPSQPSLQEPPPFEEEDGQWSPSFDPAEEPDLPAEEPPQPPPVAAPPEEPPQRKSGEEALAGFSFRKRPTESDADREERRKRRRFLP